METAFLYGKVFKVADTSLRADLISLCFGKRKSKWPSDFVKATRHS